ncbi:uncharacterized protein LOC109844677 [Asparagus officinalis]|uniref:uncharacterized protein LOC109844677 n=1 Tax=Asparagus officinalis TaxID=4686 RepID=UPI00098E4FCB|nr:uncharacterized protein LOC109844677 [Asparagus officinalis]
MGLTGHHQQIRSQSISFQILLDDKTESCRMLFKFLEQGSEAVIFSCSEVRSVHGIRNSLAKKGLVKELLKRDARDLGSQLMVTIALAVRRSVGIRVFSNGSIGEMGKTLLLW